LNLADIKYITFQQGQYHLIVMNSVPLRDYMKRVFANIRIRVLFTSSWRKN